MFLLELSLRFYSLCMQILLLLDVVHGESIDYLFLTALRDLLNESGIGRDKAGLTLNGLLLPHLF